MNQTQIIKPTVGRIVYFREHPLNAPLASIITEVHGDRCINCAIFDSNGVPFVNPPRSIFLVQPGDEYPQDGPFCEWMPYQIKKPFGSESGESLVGTQTI